MTLAGFSALTALAPDVLAQALPRVLPGAVEPGRERQLPTPPPDVNLDLTIETPRRSPVPRSVDVLRFELKDIEVVGATVFPPETLRPLWQNLIGQRVGLSDVLAVADEIEAKYRKAGYIITRAYMPPQRVSNGVFTINVVEGYVSDLAINGGDPGVHDLIAAYLQPVLSARPLDLYTMERGLLLANDLPGIQASGLLHPSPDHPGASDLVTTVNETPVTGGFATDNRGSKFTGRWTIGGDAEWNSPLGQGDQLSSSVQMAANDPSERIQGQLRYQHPIGTDGLTGSFAVTVSHGVPVATLAQFNIVTDSYAFGPRLSYPLIRTLNESLYLDGGFTFQDAKVDDTPPGTSGSQTFSHDKWRVIDGAVIYTQNGFWGGNSAATFDIAQGLPFLGATPDNSLVLSRAGAETDFTKLTASLRRTQIVSGPFSVAVAAKGQYAFEPLVVGEQITFGGYEIARGYEPSAVSGDHGFGGSFEFRYDTAFPEYFIDTLQPYVFFDAGKIWNRKQVAGSPTVEAVESTGVGVRVALPHAISGDVEFARTLLAVPGSDNGRLASKFLVNASIRF